MSPCFFRSLLGFLFELSSLILDLLESWNNIPARCGVFLIVILLHSFFIYLFYKIN